MPIKIADTRQIKNELKFSEIYNLKSDVSEKYIHI